MLPRRARARAILEQFLDGSVEALLDFTEDQIPFQVQDW